MSDLESSAEQRPERGLWKRRAVNTETGLRLNCCEAKDQIQTLPSSSEPPQRYNRPTGSLIHLQTPAGHVWRVFWF